MKRSLMVFLCTLIMVAFCACASKPGKPKGVITIANVDCYIIEQPQDAMIQKYFVLTGEVKTVYVTRLDASAFGDDVKEVYYQRVKQGGWLGFGGGRGYVIYIPEELSEQQAKIAAAELLRAEHAMSIEEARKHIKWLS